MKRKGAGSEAPRVWEFQFRWQPGPDAARDADLLARCEHLFAGNYGRWGAAHPRTGQKIRLPAGQLARLLASPDSWMASAWHGSELAGYCVAARFEVEGFGKISWVAQLVVGETFRRSGVATRLLYSMWQFSDFTAWGLATSNPFAVRALETATRRSCRRAWITRKAPGFLGELRQRVPYIPTALVRRGRGPEAIVHTNFPIDLSQLSGMLRVSRKGERRWTLGMIRSGEEWIACTFREQEPRAVSPERIEVMLKGSDDIWMRAYGGMSTGASHPWRRHTAHEVGWILSAVELRRGGRVLDVGCGDGRHAAELQAAGMHVVGVEVTEDLAERARQASGMDVQVMDARRELPPGPFDLAVCLYDVLGSSAEIADDMRILANIRSGLRAGGHLVLSVMNGELTRRALEPGHAPASLEEFVEALEALPPSTIMEQSGNVFNPSHMLFYDGVYYRKEQFSSPGSTLPAELVVRDRRYSVPEVRAVVEKVGFTVIDARPVRLGAWDAAPNPDGKEILLVARRTAG